MVTSGHDISYYGDYPVNMAPLRVWELDENATRYEKVVAAPSDEDRMIMWSLWGSVASFSVIPVFIVFMGILSSGKTRSSSFNQYLLFLMLPDIFYTSLCAINCFLNVAKGEFYSEFWCYFQSFYATFGHSGSAYMNALLAREINKMLSYGQNFRRYQSPTTYQVARNSILALTWAACVAAWGVIHKASWWPHQTVLFQGVGCFPQDYDLASTLFTYFIFTPALLMGPLAYTLYLVYRIYKHDMLPKQGRRRMLYIFFIRLVAIFLLM